MKPVAFASKGSLKDRSAKVLWASKQKRTGYEIPLYTHEQVINILNDAINIFEKGLIMATKKKIVAPAIKEKKTGIIIEAPSKAWAHDQLEAKEHISDKKVKRGFVTSEDKFVKRKEAAKIASKAGQIKDKSIKKLHSSDLRKAGGLAKKKIK